MKKTLSEKQIVDYIIENWDKLFEKDIKFQKREFQALPTYRADIMAYIDLNLKDVGYNEDKDYRATLLLECKFKSDSRDLIYELKKAMYIREYIGRYNRPVYIGVVSDYFSDKAIYDFLIENDIHMWKIDIKDNDIKTLKLRYITHGETTKEDIIIEEI